MHTLHSLEKLRNRVTGRRLLEPASLDESLQSALRLKTPDRRLRAALLAFPRERKPPSPTETHVLELLRRAGLHAPQLADGPAKLLRVRVANSSECIYLATALLASFTYEDAENGGAGVPALETASIFSDDERLPRSLRSLRSLRRGLRNDSPRRDAAPSYLCTKIDSAAPIPHVFAVVVELDKPACVKDVRISLASHVQTLWPLLDPHNRGHYRENFKIGALEWVLALRDADHFLDGSAAAGPVPDLAARTRRFELVPVLELAAGTDAVNAKRAEEAGPEPELCAPGAYVFYLLVVFPARMPALVTLLNGSLAHLLTVTVTKITDKLSRKTKVGGTFNLPMVRTPPLLAVLIADKPIYVNRVWNDALHYVITFPKKYVPLGSEHTINVKLVPLAKDVILKRIKFNVLERITYVSRDMCREYEYDSDDPYLAKNSENRVRERVVHVCELKTKLRTLYALAHEPYKEEVIKCPDNNLLFSCYEPRHEGNTRNPMALPELTTLVAAPLDINIALPFLTTKGDKVWEEPVPVRSSLPALGPMCPLLPVIGALETHISKHSDMDEDVLHLDSLSFMPELLRENIAQGYTTPSKALAPDSNFRHIQVSHRLQVCFRISKPDPRDNYRMHHYEVVVDTPLVLLSARCNDDLIQLPRYSSPHIERLGLSIARLGADDPPPSFEEALAQEPSPAYQPAAAPRLLTSSRGTFSLSEESALSNGPSTTPEDSVAELHSKDPFEQRLPLLQHMSIASVPRFKSQNDLTPSDTNGELQDILHAY